MKVKEIDILNYKSVQDVTVPLQEYGSGTNKSKTTFFVGINESGKSALLKGMSFAEDGMKGLKYLDDCYNPAQDNDEYLEIYIHVEIENLKNFRTLVSKKLGLPTQFTDKIKVLSLKKNIYKKAKTAANHMYFISINSDLPFHEYFTEEVEGGGTVIKKIEDEYDLEGQKVTKSNAKGFLTDDRKLLTQKGLESKIASKFKTTFNSWMPKFQLWRPDTKYLINDAIDLNAFKENTSISPPLKNMFSIYGKTSDDDIKSAIEIALSSQAKTDALIGKLSTAITDHINTIWEEHEVKIKVSINGAKCKIHVEDKDIEYDYTNMNQRSDGFKHFISLILSLSAQNKSNQLKKNIILIDEPEIHLHPSGVRYMRDELLKIGKNNHVFVSTHSHYMIDTNCPERHWIVSKKNNITTINQISEDTPLQDDEVLKSAFGLNLYKELLPNNILIVEGDSDKKIINHVIDLLKITFNSSIKSAKGASRTYGIAALLADEKVPAFFLFDDDNEGRKWKKKILENYKGNFKRNHVFTIYDIDKSIPQKSTLEDFYPHDIIKSVYKKEFKEEIDLKDKSPIIGQIIRLKKELKEEQDKLDALKAKFAEAFLSKYKTKASLTKSAPMLINLIKSLQEKF